jgi:hypothetical protein
VHGPQTASLHVVSPDLLPIGPVRGFDRCCLGGLVLFGLESGELGTGAEELENTRLPGWTVGVRDFEYSHLNSGGFSFVVLFSCIK